MITPSQAPPRFWPSIWSDPQFATEAEGLAANLVGDGFCALILALTGDAAAPDRLQALARDSAEAQIEYRRIQHVQRELSRGAARDQHFGHLVAAAKLIGMKSPARSMVLEIDRYRRRVYSRLRKAGTAFEAECRRQRQSVLRLGKRLHRRKRGNKAS